MIVEIFYVLLAYFFIIFVLLPLVVPFTRKKPLASRIPQEMVEQISQLEKESKTAFEYLQGAYNLILSQNHGGRFNVMLKAPLAFQTDLKKLLGQRGFMHCTQLNHLLRVYLVKSKFFSDDNIRLRVTFLNFFYHQYTQVHIAGQWYDADIMAAHTGIPLGSHAFGLR